MARCNCESSYCTHHNSVPGNPRDTDCTACPNETSGKFWMSYVGDVCDTCAEVARANGGAQFIHEKESVSS